ncbi:MAG TPA: PAS domain S-box protein [Gammaproteobacteria bacterium]|nr:PAS domain S-box protein [Gammaproteobacteria bacterium]
MTIAPRQLARPLPPLAGYVVSFAALLIAVALRKLLDPLMGDTLPLVTLFGAVAAAVWVSGYAAAIAVAVVGYVACSYLFIQPRGAVGYDSATLVGVTAYLFTCALIVVFGVVARRAHANAAERRETLRVTLRSIGDAVITTDVEARITYMNEVAESMTGRRLADAAGQALDGVFRIVNEVTRQPVESPATRALREGVIVGLANHTVLIRSDGSEVPIDDTAAPIRNELGVVSGCVLIFRDVSAQRRAEQEKASQLLTARLLASIVESSEVAIVSKSLAGIIQSWNAAAERIFGYTAAQAIGKHISIVIPPERLSEEDAIIASLKAGRRVEHFETVRRRADGNRFWVSLTVSPVKDDTGKVIGASKMVIDIDSRIRAEAERERFSTLIQNSTDFVGICDLDGVPIFVNRAGLETVGLGDLEQARRVRVWDFFFPEDRERIRDELFPSVLATGHGEAEVRFRHFKTGAAIWMSYKLVALADGAGRPMAIGTVSQDVTERKRLEDSLRALAADLSEADARKDEFLATLAHELRGPLAPLSNVLEVWKRTDDPATLVRARATMERQLGQMVRLVEDLLDLNRITHNRLELRRRRVALADLVHQAVEASRPLADSLGHELQVDLPREPVWLSADPARLAQVFGNLLHNACKYMDPGGMVSLTAERQGSEVVVAVRDTGIGIPGDQLEKIFEMFMQAEAEPEKSRGGLGIGLTLVKRLVRMHDGTIEAHSAGAGRGSTFVVRLPVLDAPAGDAPEPATRSTAAVRPARGRRVLIVDDNTDSAESLAMLLRLQGNETFTAHDGVEALEAVDERRPDVVLLDIGLPKLNGHDVARRIRERPWGKDIALVAVTGWGQEEDRRKSREAGFDAHLVKPVDRDALAELLHSLDVARERV